MATRTAERSPAQPAAWAAVKKRWRSSPAARREKVHITSSAGLTWPSSSRLQARQTMVRVLPAPGPAITSSGPSVWAITARCRSSSSGCRWRIMGEIKNHLRLGQPPMYGGLGMDWSEDRMMTLTTCRRTGGTGEAPLYGATVVWHPTQSKVMGERLHCVGDNARNLAVSPAQSKVGAGKLHYGGGKARNLSIGTTQSEVGPERLHYVSGNARNLSIGARQSKARALTLRRSTDARRSKQRKRGSGFAHRD